MASYRLIDNRMFDRLSVNKSNKSNESEETEMDKNMADFIGTWESNTVLEPVDNIRVRFVFKKVSSNNYTVASSVIITYEGKDYELINRTEAKEVNFAGIRTCISSTAYDEYINYYRAVPELGLLEPAVPYNGTNTTFTISLDKQTMVVKSEIYINREEVEKQAAANPLIAVNFSEKNLTSEFAYIKIEPSLKKID